MILRALVCICALCCAACAFARGSNGDIQIKGYADTVVIKDSSKLIPKSNKRKSAAHSRMSQSTKNRIAKIEALSKKIDKIEANIKRREAEIAKVEARE